MPLIESLLSTSPALQSFLGAALALRVLTTRYSRTPNSEAKSLNQTSDSDNRISRPFASAEEMELESWINPSPDAQKVREWRHKVQKTFLGRHRMSEQVGLDVLTLVIHNLRSPRDLPCMDELFTVMEEYNGMTSDYLKYSKINKVLSRVAVLEPEKVPGNDTYRLQERAGALVEKWAATSAAEAVHTI
ncbi:hypothetical protein BDN72DRAFT_903729 [Pluteus cervinus]|uniref:Uncharacterized protein n=1 Tax=Pluteus cervinus TaxID=181527 RepID=A0ACD3A7L6_9AGAR|nr:hypothetical protein BDN72DRAFT_903729 [Pluteus cervinus]